MARKKKKEEVPEVKKADVRKALTATVKKAASLAASRDDMIKRIVDALMDG